MDFGALSSSGTYTLALAGLIGGKRVTTHWEYKTALAEMLPDVIMEDTLYSVDGRVFTSAGGAASMDHDAAPTVAHGLRGRHGNLGR